MDEEANSWIRRTKFSHTVCHRFDASRLASVPFTIQPNRVSSVKSTANLITKQNVVQIQQENTKQRAISPTPETQISDTFKEARSIQKRFSTPNPRRKDQERRIDAKVNKNTQEINPVRHLTSMKFLGKFKSRRESASGKYFDPVGGNKVVSVETGDEHMVDLSKLYIGLKFAHGAHSQLYHGVYMDKPVAVKMIYVPDNDENGELGAQLEKQFTREVTLLSRLSHPNIIKFVGGCKKPSVFCIVTEYLPEGSLRTYLHRLENKPLPLQNLITMALDNARGMEFIHSQGVIHRDLKPENILITEDFHLKIADFGIACDEAHCDLFADPGTYRWMAPEMIKKKNYGRKVDVYGFGLILWEFFAGTIPYEDMIPIQAAFAVLNKNLRPDVPVNCPPAMKALIEQCWSLKPNKRPEFWQIVKILEEFKASFGRDGSLKLVQNPTFQDHKKGLRHWIQKLDQNRQRISSISKPKFT